MRLLRLLPLLLGVTTLTACADTVTYYHEYDRPAVRVYSYERPYEVERYRAGYYDRWGFYHEGRERIYYYGPEHYGPEHGRHHYRYWNDSYSPAKNPNRGSAVVDYSPAKNPNRGSAVIGYSPAKNPNGDSAVVPYGDLQK